MNIAKRWKEADPLVKLVGLILIIGHLLAELHGFIRDVYNKLDNIQVDWFWSSTFKLKLYLQYYIKTWFDDFLYVFILYAFAKTMLGRSIKIYMICIIFMLAHIADMVCFMYDYKQSRTVYWILAWCTTAATLILIMPKENKMKMVQ